ncbi:MAG: hypothetical protein HPY73_03720 [Methanomassiliicoccales archaeon]|nr:MAG: hypothetical protein HPY73_03720 [Methanomassiliicoccales archaeon]
MASGNMLVSYDHYAKGHAEQEVRRNIEEVGAHLVSIEETDFEGLFEVRVNEDPRKVVFDLRSMCKDYPEKFIHTHHWVPITTWVPAYIDEMAKVTAEWGKLIGKNDRWMLHLHKRHVGEHSADLIERLTAPINSGKVDLHDPDLIIVVEILGDWAGMALLKRSQILDVGKMRRELERDIL